MRLLWADLPVEIAGAVRLSKCSRPKLHGGFYAARLLLKKNPATATYRPTTGMRSAVQESIFVVGHFVTGPETQYGLSKIVSPGSNHDVTYALPLGYRF